MARPLDQFGGLAYGWRTTLATTTDTLTVLEPATEQRLEEDEVTAD